MNPETAVADEPQPARRALTSLFRYSPAMLAVVIALADLSRFVDPDLWGHVRFGQAVLQAGHIIRRDPYSFTALGHRWLNHEWLTEVIMGALYNSLNVFGLKLMKLGCAALTMLFLAAAENETEAPTLLQFAILLTSAVTIAPQVQFRPQVFTFALLSALIFMLTRDLYRRRGSLWLAVPMLALWANLHGGFILGVATLAIYSAVSGAQDIAGGRGFGRAIRLGTITLVATLATLATPYGVGTWQAVLHALENPFTRTVISDWQSIAHQYSAHWRSDQLSVLYLQLAMCLIAALTFSFILTPVLDDLPLVAIAAMMSISAFISVRNVPAAVIAIAVPLARHLPLAIGRRWPGLGLNSGPSEPSSRLNQLVLVAVSMLIFVQSDFFSNRLYSVDPYPIGACRFIKEHKLGGNLLSQFSWGEYIIWHLEPESKVFVDGRYDTVYPDDVLRDFMFFNYNRVGGAAALSNYPTQYVLLDPNSVARKLMDSRHDWRLIYQDNAAVLYARADSAAAKIAGAAVKGSTPMTSFP